MPGLNRIIITGRLTADPELRYTEEEAPITRFTIEVKKEGGLYRGKLKKETREADCFNCVAHRGLANVVAEYYAKGSMVTVEGRLKVYPKEHGKKTSSYIEIDNMLMLDKKFYKATTKSEIEA